MAIAVAYLIAVKLKLIELDKELIAAAAFAAVAFLRASIPKTPTQ